MILTKKQTYIFYPLLLCIVLLACFAHLHITFQVLLCATIICAPLVFDDTKTIATYLFGACFMACFGGGGFLTALSISLLFLEIKKIIIAIKTKQDIENIKKIVIVWIILVATLTLYSLVVNKFKVYRMVMFLDFVQCCIACYLVRKNIDIKYVLFTLFAGIVCSVTTSLTFEISNIENKFIAGSLDDRFGAFFNNINTLSVYCTLCASCFVVLLLTNKLKLKYCFYFPIITTLIGLLTYSKAFFVISALLYVSWLVLEFIKSANKKKFILFSIILITCLTFVAFLARSYVESIINRFVFTNYNSPADNFTTGRITIWKQYIDRWLKNPMTFLFGNGYTSQKIATKQYEHSIYIAFLNQFGVIGTGIIIFTLIWTLRKCAKLQKNIAYYIPIVLLLINGIVSNLSGVLCTSLIWFMALYFVANSNIENVKTQEQSIQNTSNENTN